MKTETHAVIEMGTSTAVAARDDRALAPPADVTTGLEIETSDVPTTETVVTGGMTIVRTVAEDERPGRIGIRKLLRRSPPRTRGTGAPCSCSSLLRG